MPYETIIRLYNAQGEVIAFFKTEEPPTMHPTKILSYKTLYPDCVRITMDIAIPYSL